MPQSTSARRSSTNRWLADDNYVWRVIHWTTGRDGDSCCKHIQHTIILFYFYLYMTRILPWVAVFITTPAAIYSLGNGLHTFTAVSRSRQPSVLSGKMRSAFGLSNNNKWQRWCGDGSSVPVDSQPKLTGLVWGSAAIWRWVCIHQVNWVNARNGSELWRQTAPQTLSGYYYYYILLIVRNSSRSNSISFAVNLVTDMTLLVSKSELSAAQRSAILSPEFRKKFHREVTLVLQIPKFPYNIMRKEASMPGTSSIHLNSHFKRLYRQNCSQLI